MHLKQRHPHLQVVLSVGGSTASEVFPVVASSTLLRDNFARLPLASWKHPGLMVLTVSTNEQEEDEQRRR